MILCQKPPKNFIKIDVKTSMILQMRGFFPMYKWESYHYYHPSDELKEYIKNGGE